MPVMFSGTEHEEDRPGGRQGRFIAIIEATTALLGASKALQMGFQRTRLVRDKLRANCFQVHHNPGNRKPRLKRRGLSMI